MEMERVGEAARDMDVEGVGEAITDVTIEIARAELDVKEAIAGAARDEAIATTDEFRDMASDIEAVGEAIADAAIDADRDLGPAIDDARAVLGEIER